MTEEMLDDDEFVRTILNFCSQCRTVAGQDQ